jgi:hypothetical protein
MKARITAVLATLVVALSLVAGASAAPHKGTVKGWDYYNGSSWSGLAPAASKTWSTKAWSVKPWASAGWTRATA